MNTAALISGILLLLIGIFIEALLRATKSSSWPRARIFIIMGIVVTVLAILLP